MASERIIEATIGIAKLICFNQGHPSFFRIFNVLNVLIIITWNPTETNSQQYWEYGHYLVILSSF